MRFLIIPRPGPSDGAPDGSCDFRDDEFDAATFEAQMRFNEETTKAGVLIAAEGLDPTAKPVAVGVRRGKRAPLDGPFAETKELVAGFYLIEVASRDEAIGWALRCPIARGHELLEIRQLTAIETLPRDLQDRIAAVAPTWSASVTARR
jgi:hypothetical protein